MCSEKKGQVNKRTVANRGELWRFEKPWRGTARFVVRFAKKPNRAVSGRFAVRQDTNRTAAVWCGPCEPPWFVEPWSTLGFIVRMGASDNFSTDISELLHISNVKDAYRASNRVNFMRQVLAHNDRHTALDYMHQTLRWLALSVDHGSPRFAPRFAKTPHQNFRRN